jgi:hypothetical protein
MLEMTTDADEEFGADLDPEHSSISALSGIRGDRNGLNILLAYEASKPISQHAAICSEG